VFVCLSARISREPHAIFASFSVHVAYGHGSVLLWQGDEMLRKRGSFYGFSPLTVHCIAFTAKAIIQLPTSCSRRDHSMIPSLPRLLQMGSAGDVVTGVHSAGEV